MEEASVGDRMGNAIKNLCIQFALREGSKQNGRRGPKASFELKANWLESRSPGNVSLLHYSGKDPPIQGAHC